MPKVYVYNFIPVLSGKTMEPVPILNCAPEDAAELVRQSCREKRKSFEEWGRLIRHNCVIPENHPYRKLLTRKKIGSQDPLWTLGAIAFGTENSWVVFSGIVWDNGGKDYPEQLDKEWSVTPVKSF